MACARQELCPKCAPPGHRTVGLLGTKDKRPTMQAFCLVGETGFEPATARPPAGYVMAGQRRRGLRTLYGDDPLVNLWAQPRDFQCGVRAAAELSRARQAAHEAPRSATAPNVLRYNLLPHFRDTVAGTISTEDVDRFKDDLLERVAPRPEDPRDPAWRDGPRECKDWIATNPYEKAETVTVKPSDDFDQSEAWSRRQRHVKRQRKSRDRPLGRWAPSRRERERPALAGLS